DRFFQESRLRRKNLAILAGDETRPANMFNLPASTRSRGSLPRGYPGRKLAGRKTCVKTEFSTP
ncbi:MAG TPA: hypothetical protein VMV69_12830, partial [Pirellulales bacterium]|nr:hypothetical protein [Pirellulales bacterium]